MAAEDYESKAAKQDPETGAVAVANRQWAVMTVDNGGYYASHDDVADWPDVTAATTQ